VTRAGAQFYPPASSTNHGLGLPGERHHGRPCSERPGRRCAGPPAARASKKKAEPASSGISILPMQPRWRGRKEVGLAARGQPIQRAFGIGSVIKFYPSINGYVPPSARCSIPLRPGGAAGHTERDCNGSSPRLAQGLLQAVFGRDAGGLRKAEPRGSPGAGAPRSGSNHGGGLREMRAADRHPSVDPCRSGP
jgi:hypothetical protein